MTKNTSTERARAYRKRMREKGYRRVTFWVPDLKTPEFGAEAHREALAIADSPFADEDQDFIDSISIFNEEFENE